MQEEDVPEGHRRGAVAPVDEPARDPDRRGRAVVGEQQIFEDAALPVAADRDPGDAVVGAVDFLNARLEDVRGPEPATLLGLPQIASRSIVLRTAVGSFAVPGSIATVMPVPLS
jgi:hypothetical protein